MPEPEPKKEKKPFLPQKKTKKNPVTMLTLNEHEQGSDDELADLFNTTSLDDPERFASTTNGRRTSLGSSPKANIADDEEDGGTLPFTDAALRPGKPTTTEAIAAP